MYKLIVVSFFAGGAAVELPKNVVQTEGTHEVLKMGASLLDRNTDPQFALKTAQKYGIRAPEEFGVGSVTATMASGSQILASAGVGGRAKQNSNGLTGNVEGNLNVGNKNKAVVGGRAAGTLRETSSEDHLGGEMEGAASGHASGNIDGIMNGDVDGAASGTAKGALDGSTNFGNLDLNDPSHFLDGSVVGRASGSVDGAATGTASGELTGIASGYTEGTSEGRANGSIDGDADLRFGDSGAVGTATGIGHGDVDGLASGVASGVLNGVARGSMDGSADGVASGDIDGTTTWTDREVVSSAAFGGSVDGVASGTAEGSLARGGPSGRVTGHAEGSASGSSSGTLTIQRGQGHCFSADSTVLVMNPKSRTIVKTALSDVTVGDRVVSMDHTQTKRLATVKGLPHSTSVGDFIEFRLAPERLTVNPTVKQTAPTLHGDVLSLRTTEFHTFPKCPSLQPPPTHLRHSAHSLAASDMIMLEAHEIRPGDCLLALDGEHAVVSADRRLAESSDVTYSVLLEGAADLLVVGGVVTHAKPSHHKHKSVSAPLSPVERVHRHAIAHLKAKRLESA
jgi:hypothetical protein